MFIMVDATNISVGGGLQVSISVINELLNEPQGKRFVYVVSRNVYIQLEIPINKLNDVLCVDLKKTNLFSYLSYFKFMRSIEKKYKVKLVFSIFGPTYWRPRKARHLIGFANAWLVYSDTKAYEIFTFLKRIAMRTKNSILGSMLYYQNAHYVTETNAIKTAFCKKFNCAPSIIDVVPNCISQQFILSEIDLFDLSKIDGFKFCTITHNYPHKNLEIIAKVGRVLEEMGFNFVFIVTIAANDYELLDNDFKKYTKNIGPVDVSQCSSVYEYSDALFLPTLIECFTVSYLEALHSNKPIVTSDLDFAHDICSDAAFYFNPYNVESVADICAKVISSKMTDSMEINRKLCKYPLIKSKFKGNKHRVTAYMNIIDKILGS